MSARHVVFLTDFGNRDWYAGTLHGVVLSVAPETRIIDLTHAIDPGDITAAAFALEASYRFFPEGTVFCCVVDPGVGTKRAGVCATDGRYYFVAPDNGLLGRVVRITREARAELRAHRLSDAAFFLPNVSNTYHGRDVFSPVAAHLSLGVDVSRFGPAHELYLPPEDEPRRTSGRIEGRIVYVDVYGNLFTNIRATDLDRETGVPPADWRLTIQGPGDTEPVTLSGLSATFGEVDRGQPLFYIGSSGYVEIAVNQGRADDFFQARTGFSVFLENKSATGRP